MGLDGHGDELLELELLALPDVGPLVEDWLHGPLEELEWLHCFEPLDDSDWEEEELPLDDELLLEELPLEEEPLADGPCGDDDPEPLPLDEVLID